VHLLRDGRQTDIAAGEEFSLTELGADNLSQHNAEIDPDVWQMVLDAEEQSAKAASEVETPPDEVFDLLSQRNAARDSKDWSAADDLRDQISSLGWKIMDTPEGSELLPVDERES